MKSISNWQSCEVKASASIMDAIGVIDSCGYRVALVMDENGCLAGTVTDGDVRRGILRGLALHEPVTAVMNGNPVVGTVEDGPEELLARMKRKRLLQMPIVDAQKRVKSLQILNEEEKLDLHQHWVVIMAGGLGSRLSSLTKDRPKPLLEVGKKPILETVLESLKMAGFQKFFFSVNYKAEQIEEHFGDGSQWGVEIRYLREKERLGTAGALALLPEKPIAPILVMNADVLTKLNFEKLVDFHIKHRSQATMVVRTYDLEVPFGVVNVMSDIITGIDEKPVQRFFVNAGIYVLEPETLGLVPPNRFFDMPDIFDELINRNVKTHAFPVREYWLDIGRKDQFEKARQEYPGVFSDEDETEQHPS